MLYDRAIDQVIMAAKVPATSQIGFRASADSRDLADRAHRDGARLGHGRRRPPVSEPHRRDRDTSVGATAPWLFYTDGDTWKTSTFERRPLQITVKP